MLSGRVKLRTELSGHLSQGNLALAALFLLSLALFQINLSRAPHPDELYHVLAAKGLLEFGEPRIAEGIYTRGYAHTWLIAQLFRWFEPSMVTARLPSAVAMSFVVVLIFYWLRNHADVKAAWIGALLFLVSPFAIDIAQFARFYGFQTLAFVSASMLFYHGINADRYRRVFALFGSIALFAVAVYFQQTSLIGIAAVMAWATVRLAFPWFLSDSVKRTHKWALVAGACLLGVAIVAISHHAGLLQGVIDTYRSSPLFNRGNSHNFLFYHAWYNLYYPSIWPAIGFITLIAIVKKPQAALFATAVFFIGLVINSFAAQKNLRYLIYAQPFLFIVLGIALSGLLDSARDALRRLHHALAASLPFGSSTSGRLSTLLIAGALVLLIVGNPATIRSATLLAGITIPPEKKPIDWESAEPALLPLLKTADIVVTMAELEMLYFYDDYDLLVSASRLEEIPDGKDFSPDYRTGRPVIGSAIAMERVFQCYDNGIFVTNTRRWGQSNLIAADVSQVILDNTESVDLPKRSGVLAFSWNNSNAPRHAQCDGLPDISRQP